MDGFDAVRARENLIRGLKALSEEEHFSKVVLGISGGKDSTVCAALCARAFGPENVYGVMLPDKVQSDISDSIRVCEALGIHSRIVNIGKMHEALLDALDLCPEGKAGDKEHPEAGEGTSEPAGFPVPYVKESDVNVGPRLRMTTLRYIGQAIGARLVGTGNLSEATVGYCTKDGDTSCDFALLGTLTSKEVVAVGLTMEEVPAELVEKTPTDGLSGKSDEEKLGISYQAIHDYIRKGTSGDPETDARIHSKETANIFKRRMPKVISAFEE